MPVDININSVLADLNLVDACIELDEDVVKLYNIFNTEKSLPGIIIKHQGRYNRFLSRTSFFETVSKQFMYEMLSRRKLDFFLGDTEKNTTLILNSSTSIILAAHEALQRTGDEIFDPILVSFGHNEFKILDFHQLLLAQNRIQHLMNGLLKQANEFKQEVLAIVAHDLRNPISTILGFSELIGETFDAIKMREFSGYIHKIARQMEDLVTNFLGSAINNSIVFDLELSWFDLYELISTSVVTFRNKADSKHQMLYLEAPTTDSLIYSDKIRIREIVDNLLSNAIKYSGEDKVIRIVLSMSDSMGVIKVIDQGPGFSDADLKKIFGKFQRLSAKPTANESSTGMGLFIVKKIVDSLDGSINLDTKLNSGSTFTVSIPVTRKMCPQSPMPVDRILIS